MSHALIIEDEWALALLLQETLKEMGYSAFDMVPSVRGAIEAAQQRCPDLIVADHRIIDGTGTDAVLIICADKPIPVIFVIASGSEVRERLPDALIIEKPFDLSVLRAGVAEASLRPFRSPT